MSEKLLPCPFCGVIPESGNVDERFESSYNIVCTNNACTGMPSTENYDTPAEAITAWNTRTPDPETVKVLEELYAALLTDSRGKTVTGDDVEYHLNGSDMYIAVNKVRNLLSRLEGAK